MIDLFEPFGFVTVGQDMRGTMRSDGNFSIWHADANDSEDLGNWIVQQPWSNGKIYSFGASADGLGAFTMIYNQPKWLSSQYFIWTSSIGYEILYPNGAFLENLVTRWMESTVPAEGTELVQTMKENEIWNDWWDAITMTGKYDRVHGASAFWAGWYDIFLPGTLAAYNGYNTECDEAYRYTSKLVIDPLGHCQDAAKYFPQDLIQGRSALGLLQAYELYGVHDIRRQHIKNITFYVMSSNDDAGLNAGNYWTTVETFPHTTITKYYLHKDDTNANSNDGTASTDRPAIDNNAISTTYKYDPSNPVLSNGGNNLFITCGPEDQSEVDDRDDVLRFTTSALTEELVLTGPLTADLYVSSTAIDTDFMVKIEDVYPTGEKRLLQDSAIRMRWREGNTAPVMMTPGDVYHVSMTLWNTSYIVAPGHALRFVVTSSNSPRFSINNNNGVLLKDGPGTPIVAMNTIYHSARYPSSVNLPVVRKALIPKHPLLEEIATSIPDLNKILETYPDLFDRLAGRMAKYA